MSNDQIFNMLLNIETQKEILMDVLRKRNISWKTFARKNFTPEAVRKYREINKCNFKDAYDAVKNFQGVN